ncbi:hypothetical protein SAMN05518672_1011246 [Chitinophaga sp. CF118]|uniref:hypothetical protein n=1 Tax=Chitinophaga sp. CF118 TaxID=1884367 RepID=UPI0008E3C5C4|nr:hypothetical protein [Chitinophaga sp. CF118]SFD24655.1 hypothetical protein SAMN05518672_1011246 [Chitinophaga sp. CF118]
MKRYLFALIALSSLSILSSCSKDDNNDNTNNNGTDSSGFVIVKGDITANQTWTANKKYLLNSFVYVKSGVTLTIEPGTVIMGDKANKGTLVVTRGGKLMAEGTAAKPIVFTSSQAAGARSAGDWGGIILLGKAKVNPTVAEAKIEGGLIPTNGGDEKTYIWYGGTDDADNSGSLKYIRIEFAGLPYTPDNEINGLTMGGVGSGTKISYIQVYRSGDDAFEWFGGSVNCDHLVATNSWDDDFDTDNGFSGKVQFGVAQRYKSTADVSGSNGFESDNDSNGSENAPQTSAVFSNMTIIGPIQSGNSTSGINANFQHAAQIRRNSSISIYNSLLVGFPVALYIDDSKVVGNKTSQNAIAGKLVFKNNIIAGCTTSYKGEWLTANTAAWTTWIAGTGTEVLTNVADVLISDAYKYSAGITSTATAIGTPSFLLKAGASALTGADFTGLTGFTTVAYRGAFDGTTDWTTGWTTAGAEVTAY